jgi:hypothetical protein
MITLEKPGNLEDGDYKIVCDCEQCSKSIRISAGERISAIVNILREQFDFVWGGGEGGSEGVDYQVYCRSHGRGDGMLELPDISEIVKIKVMRAKELKLNAQINQRSSNDDQEEGETEDAEDPEIAEDTGPELEVDELNAAVIGMRDGGGTYREIAEEFDISRSKVYRILKKHGRVNSED